MTTQKQSMEIMLSYDTQTRAVLVHVKSEDVYADLAGNVEKKFDTSNFEVERTLPLS